MIFHSRIAHCTHFSSFFFVRLPFVYALRSVHGFIIGSRCWPWQDTKVIFKLKGVCTFVSFLQLFSQHFVHFHHSSSIKLNELTFSSSFGLIYSMVTIAWNATANDLHTNEETCVSVYRHKRQKWRRNKKVYERRRRDKKQYQFTAYFAAVNRNDESKWATTHSKLYE